MSIAFIAGLAVVLLIIAIAIAQRSGPRVTHIERRIEQEEEGKEP